MKVFAFGSVAYLDPSRVDLMRVYMGPNTWFVRCLDTEELVNTRLLLIDAIPQKIRDDKSVINENLPVYLQFHMCICREMSDDLQQ